MSEVINANNDPSNEAFNVSKASQESAHTPDASPKVILGDTDSFPITRFDLEQRAALAPNDTDGPTTREFKAIINHSYDTDASVDSSEHIGRHRGSVVENDSVQPAEVGKHTTFTTRVEAAMASREAKKEESLVSRAQSVLGAVATRVAAASATISSFPLRDRLKRDTYAGRHRETRAEARARRQEYRQEESMFDEIFGTDQESETDEVIEPKVITIPVGIRAIEGIFAKAGRLYGAAEQKIGLGLTAGANALSRMAMTESSAQAGSRAERREQEKFLRKKKVVLAVGGVATLVAGYLTYKGFMDDSSQHIATATDQLGNVPPLGEPSAMSAMGVENVPPIGEPVPVDAVNPSAGQFEGVGFGESDYSTTPLESFGNGQDGSAGGAEFNVSDVFTGEKGMTHLTEAGLSGALDWIDGYEVKKGDSVWELSERIAAEHFGVKNPSVSQIDAIKDRLVPALKKAGAVNSKGWLSAGDIINIK